MLKLDGVVFGTQKEPAITIHSNQGLPSICLGYEKDIPGMTITALRCLAVFHRPYRMPWRGKRIDRLIIFLLSKKCLKQKDQRLIFGFSSTVNRSITGRYPARILPIH